MTQEEAFAAAERVLALINSSPRTPTKEQVAEAIGYVLRPSYEAALMSLAVWAKHPLRDGKLDGKP